ncbi:uncharacterized protein LOC128198747 [Bicyclus anynana]|uniref:Uncharacterized protein LOC128198747 n=1 Tax=Bicyclus anynana TaxID=110368 RepID=A0ABM3LR03_BICAN|nr:uncharacterized protein LOC128198747 [Bicyclus anynana]
MNLEKFQQWKLVLKDDVKGKEDSYIYNSVRICDSHFEACYRSASRRLTRNAVPTLNLPVTPLAVSYPMETEMDVEMEVPCSQQAELNKVQIQSKVNLFSSESAKRRLRPKVNTQRQSKELRAFKAQILKLKIKCKSLTERVNQARKLSQSEAFQKTVEKLPEPAAIFVNMQLKKSCKKPRGRRFTMKEKILCLTIYKQSQKAYSFLQKTFGLPSKRTMQKVLSSISLTPGINDTMLKHLAKTVRKLPEEKKLCTLIFDEVALTPGLYFQNHLDEIGGFEDFGAHRTSKIADHALVFMLKSIKGKYKQPICFTFCQSATNSVDLKMLIKNIIEQVNSIGLKIIATVCDQSPTNMKVIKNLVTETKEKYLRNGTEYRSMAFEVNNSKIFPIFDPPHLLKGLRNNLMTKKLKFVQNGETKFAKWEHLQMLLDIDAGEHDIRLVNKLTESHVNKEKVPKMKVKHAAQVFSQRVSAALRFLAIGALMLTGC